MTVLRRTFLHAAAATLAGCALHPAAFAQADARRRFQPAQGRWRTFEVTTRVELASPDGAAQLWLPIPSIDSDWQQSLESSFTSSGTARIAHDTRYGAKMLAVSFRAGEPQPFAEITSRVRTRDRAVDWSRTAPRRDDPATLAQWTQPTDLLPTDGIVHSTALAAVGSAKGDVERARRIYDWVVANTYREPTVRGCGEGDIKTMLETGSLGGKCVDINSVFVGLCRSLGIPARDLYGLRLAPSAFGYRELGGNPANLKGSQHCRAEVYLQAHGWVAVDPADVAKVMRMETPTWIRDPRDPLVAPVNDALFGGWEGNWLAWNSAHDLSLPQAKGPKVGFLMYPVAEDNGGRFESYAPDDFKYRITAREITA